MFLIPILSFILLTIGHCCGSLKSYDGWSLVRATAENSDQLTYLNTLGKNDSVGVEVWLQGALKKPFDLFVSPQAKEPLIAKLGELQIKCEVVNENMQRSIEQERVTVPADSRGLTSINNSDWFTQYLKLDEINKAIKKLAKEYPHLVKVETIGKTHEGRILNLVTISAGSSGSKPAIWIDGGIHAREWLSPATALFVLNKLITEYSTNSTITRYVDQATFHIIPVLNADGYHYAHEKDRMWRKNRRPCSTDDCCEGADLNRNFDHEFGGAGTSPESCSQTYTGPSAFSEPESQAVRDFLAKHKNVKAYITLHCYSQMWFFPYGSKQDFYPQDVKELEDVAKRAAAALEAVHGTKYEVGSAADILYPSGGGSDDWAKEKAGIKYSYTLELRPGRKHGGNGFVMPPSEIVPTGEETFAGLSVVFDAVIGSKTN